METLGEAIVVVVILEGTGKDKEVTIETKKGNGEIKEVTIGNKRGNGEIKGDNPIEAVITIEMTIVATIETTTDNKTIGPMVTGNRKHLEQIRNKS